MGKLLAGAAKRCITPPQVIFEAVVEENERYSYKEIKEDTFVRVIVLSDGQQKMAIIASDLSVYPVAAELVKTLEVRFGFDPINCVVGGTRAHNAFSAGAGSFDALGKNMVEFVKFVHDKTVDAVQEAIGKMVPARIGGAIGESCINACRDFPTPIGTIEAPNRVSGTVARQLPVVHVTDLNGDTIAIFINYAMQSACLSWNQFMDSYNYYCGDFTVAVTRYLESHGKEKYPVLWTCGGGDDQHASVEALVEYCGINEDGEYEFVREVLPPEATLMLIRRMAAEQSADVYRTIKSIKSYSDEYNLFSAETYREVSARKVYRQGLGDRKIPGSIPVPEKVEPPIKFRFRLTVINDIAFLGVNADLYSSHFARVKEILGVNTISILDASFGSVSSLPDAANEVDNIYGIGAWGGRCYSAAEAQERLVDAVTELAEEYRKQANKVKKD